MQPAILAVLEKITEEEQRILDGAGTVDRDRYSDSPMTDFVVDREKMLARGELIALRTHTRFVNFPLHSHNYIEAMYVCAGRITHVIGGSRVVMGPGDLLLLGRHTGHEILSAGRQDIGVNFIILPEFFEATLGILDQGNALLEFLTGVLCSTAPERYLLFATNGLLQIDNLLENLVYSLLHKKRENRANQLLMGLLFLYLSQSPERVKEGTPSRYEDMAVLTVLQYIECRYTTASLTEAAGQLGQPLSSLSRLVRRQTGSTFKELLQNKRFQVAVSLLRNTSLSVNDIILQVGYENSSYFYRRFRQRYGVSPRMYRLSHGKGEGAHREGDNCPT